MESSPPPWVIERRHLCGRIKELIVEALVLEIDGSWIGDDTPLIGRGLEFDSLDALDLLICIEENFNLRLDEEDIGLFASVNSLADRIEIGGGLASQTYA